MHASVIDGSVKNTPLLLRIVALRWHAELILAILLHQFPTVFNANIAAAVIKVILDMLQEIRITCVALITFHFIKKTV